MNIVITMAGLGSRFLKAGFTKPKFMIEAGDKTLFELSMLSLSDYFPHTHEILFITKKELNAKTFIETICKKLGISFFSIIELDSTTDGQATTAAIGIKNLPRNESVLIYNIDTYIEPGALKFSELVGDGSIPCFKAEGDHWSFVEGTGGIAKRVVEKQRISDNCSLGAYYFKTGSLYLNTYEEFYQSGNFVGEKYIAPMYKAMIDGGLKVTYSLVDSKKVHVLGTPEELEAYLKQISSNN